tara:strand:- start:6425 stop:7537 length:1113 start_codon:yes stop_codon:yes gene_type:complete
MYVLRMYILFLESFYGGSHRDFADGFKGYWPGKVDLITLPARFWKWRVRGAAFEFLQRVNKSQLSKYDAVFVTSLIGLADIKSHWGASCPPVILYMHECQLNYPLPKGESLDVHFVMNDLSNLMHADKILFNSEAHRKKCFESLSKYMRKMPDFVPRKIMEKLPEKSEVVYPGCHFNRTQKFVKWPDKDLTIVWNHRWEFDKQPDQFFSVLYKLKDLGIPFRLRVLGENFQVKPKVFEDARIKLSEFIDHWGYLENRESYYQNLRDSQIVISTAIQENFGISIVEAIAMGCFPLLPMRLSYPEILPGQYHSYSLYRGSRDLTSRLKRLLVKPKYYENLSRDLACEMQKYSWSKQITYYKEAVRSSLEKSC